MKNMGDIAKMAQRMQADMAKAQADLAEATVEGTAGVGPKTAQRLAYHILRTQSADAEALAAAIRSVKTDLRYCSVCFNIAETDPCAICSSDERDARVVCIVEEPLDVLAIERTGQF